MKACCRWSYGRAAGCSGSRVMRRVVFQRDSINARSTNIRSSTCGWLGRDIKAPITTEPHENSDISIPLSFYTRRRERSGRWTPSCKVEGQGFGLSCWRASSRRCVARRRRQSERRMGSTSTSKASGQSPSRRLSSTVFSAVLGQVARHDLLHCIIHHDPAGLYPQHSVAELLH